MKRIVCTISVLLCLAAFFAAGQDVRTRAFWDKLADNCVSLSYSFQTRAAVPVSGSCQRRAPSKTIFLKPARSYGSLYILCCQTMT